MSVFELGGFEERKALNKDRRGKRRKLYLGELTSVVLQFDSCDFHCEATDLSPNGIGVVTAAQSFMPKREDRVFVTYTSRDGKKFASWGVVASAEQQFIRGESKLRIGVAFATVIDNVSDIRNHESTRLMRVACPEGYFPPAFCEDPFFFHERIHLQIVEFFAAGMCMKTVGFHATLLPNVILNMVVFLPMLGQHKISARIVTVIKGNGDESFLLELELFGECINFRNDVSQFLLMSGAVRSVDDLRDKLFSVGSLDRAFSFRYAQSQADFNEIQKLRRAPLDKYDAFSRQILGVLCDNIVASVRLVFTEGDPNRSELEAASPGIPQRLWVQKFVELSRFHCAEGFAARDVYMLFLQHAVRITVESGYRFLLTGCSENSLALYESIGFRRVRKVGEHPPDTSRFPVVVALDVHKLLSSNGLAQATLFDRYYADIAKYVGQIPQTMAADADVQVFWSRR
jgi:hypothetical protein